MGQLRKLSKRVGYLNARLQIAEAALDQMVACYKKDDYSGMPEIALSWLEARKELREAEKSLFSIKKRSQVHENHAHPTNAAGSQECDQ